MSGDSFEFPHDVRGWLSRAQGELLFKLSQRNPSLGRVVELGSYHGKSTICLAQGSRKVGGGPIYAVDNFVGGPYVGMGPSFFAVFRENIEKHHLADGVAPLVSDSASAGHGWTGGAIRLLFIDADHSYSAVRNDFTVWEKHIPVGGIVAFHDTLAWPGVIRFVAELILQGTFADFKTRLGSGGLTYAVKSSSPKPLARRWLALGGFFLLQLFTLHEKAFPLLVTLRRKFSGRMGQAL